MKSKDLYDLLIVAQRFKSGDAVGPLGEVAKIFAVLPNKSVADAVKRLGNLQTPVAAFGTRLESVTEAIVLLRGLFAGRAKEGIVKDLCLLEELSKRFGEAALDTFVSSATEALSATPVRAKPSKKPVRTDLVDSYNRRLEQALGDDPSFQSIYGELVSDAEMGSPEAAALARRFAHAAARSRDAALKKIFARHQALMTSRAKSLATAGRVAG